MKWSCVTLASDPDEEIQKVDASPALLPLALVPPSPGIFVVLIAVVEIGALGASPLPARGMVVGAMPASYPSELSSPDFAADLERVFAFRPAQRIAIGPQDRRVDIRTGAPAAEESASPGIDCPVGQCQQDWISVVVRQELPEPPCLLDGSFSALYVFEPVRRMPDACFVRRVWAKAST